MCYGLILAVPVEASPRLVPRHGDWRCVAPAYGFALKFSDRTNATAGLQADISRPLVLFLEELVAIEGDWNEERSLRDADRGTRDMCQAE
jgi:hypothetical protein